MIIFTTACPWITPVYLSFDGPTSKHHFLAITPYAMAECLSECCPLETHPYDARQISDMCMHFVEKYDMMVVKVLSKWELRRICNAVHATALVRMGAPTPDEMGTCALVEVQEVGLRKVTVFSQDDDDSRIATIVLRAR